MKCQICENLQGLCNLHKPKETSQERAQRKALYIARGTALYDSEDLRKELENKFEEFN